MIRRGTFTGIQGGVILALPRGRCGCGYAMSADLHLPPDVFITRKIGAPEIPEYAVGAISETGHIYLNLETASKCTLRSSRRG